jgi:hypothetical protein
LAEDTVLAAVAGDLACDTDGATNVDAKAPALSTTLDPLGFHSKAGSGRRMLK